jgi:hypothetical protein
MPPPSRARHGCCGRGAGHRRSKRIGTDGAHQIRRDACPSVFHGVCGLGDEVARRQARLDFVDRVSNLRPGLLDLGPHFTFRHRFRRVVRIVGRCIGSHLT